jgi:DNA-binding winged helix-turn-helix (wHTH) protein/TolB-like protein/Flp pilus assembly protein TadD
MMLLKKQGTYRFDGFRLDGRQRLLERGGIPVNIAPKVLDALLLLVEDAGALVERSTMRERLWQGQIVEAGTLSRVIADLRKALGDVTDERRYIETVPKFGYRFVASVAVVPEAETPPPESPAVQKLWKRKRTIQCVAGLLCLAAAGFGVRRMQPYPAAVQSLLILPFQIIGKAPEAEMLEFGLQDSLTMELSGLSSLAVFSLRPATAESADDVVEIGRRHRAQYILAGTIQQVSDKIFVNVRLLRAATGQTIWTNRFEEHNDDVFLVQSRLAKLAVAELVPALPAREGDLVARRLPSNGAAYRYYLLGRHYWNRRDENAYTDAIEMFTKAVEADPFYAPGYVGLADSYLLATGNANGLEVTLPRAKLAVEKAIKIDPSLGEAHATLALIASNYYFDWDLAEKELQTAIRLSPNYVTAHHWYAEFLTMRGKFAFSEAEFDVARNLDPASPIILTDLAQLYNFEKKYRRSIETLDEALRLEPSFRLAHYRKGYALMLLRRPEEALTEFERANLNNVKESWISEAAWVAAVEGRRQEAIELARQAEQGEPNAFVLSVTWAELGEFDRAIEWLQKLYDMRSGGLTSLNVNPVFDRLRSQQSFRALLRRMNVN